MPVLVLAGRLALALVFMVAGGAKLSDLSGSRQALVEFGIPKRIAPFAGVALPILELAIGISLTLTASWRWGAFGALVLLLLFTGGIAVNLWQGRRPPCHCFGQLYSKPTGPATLVRTVVLAALAAFVVWQGEQAENQDWLEWIYKTASLEAAIYVSAGVIAVLLSVVIGLLLQIVSQQGRLLLRLDLLEQRVVETNAGASTKNVPGPTLGLAVGAAAPDFNLTDVQGQKIDLRGVLISELPALLVFTNPACGPCQALLPDISRWQREFAGLFTLIIIGEGSAEDNRAKMDAQGKPMILLQRRREVAELYQAWGTPAAVLVRSDARIGSALASGPDAIRNLVAQLSAKPLVPVHHSESAPASPAKIGDTAPAIPLHYLDRRNTSLGDFRGRETLVIFWNPRCGFCQQMLPALRMRETVAVSRKIVVISSGTEEEIQAMQLRSTVLVDPTSVLAPALGAYGTPMGILIDAEGRVASKIASGAEAILNLLDSKVEADAVA
jgi:peroxiredoxin/uncharacterized membrane protein YphA (DoxX/SURF4 family)